MSRVIPDTVSTPQELPGQVDVVIIGGGIVGVSAALFLAESGVSVALCEKGLIAAEQSSRNWGWVRQMGRDVSEIPLAMQSLAIWRGFNERTGEETGFRQRGIIGLCHTEQEIAVQEDWIKTAHPYGIECSLVSGSALRDLLPGIRQLPLAAIVSPSDGCAEPTMAGPAIARAAARKGASILTRCAVRAVERQAGRISGVVTERGTIKCSNVILAGGAWSRLFAGNMGLDLPALKVYGSAGRVGPVSSAPESNIYGPRYAFRRRLDGGYTVARRNANVVPIGPDSFKLFFDYIPKLAESWKELLLRIDGRFFSEYAMPKKWSADEITPFETLRILDPSPVKHYVRRGFSDATGEFPPFSETRFQQMWGGVVDVSPDAVPTISPVSSIPGFFLATGFSGHGFGVGPGAGRLIADMVTGATPSVDPHPFRMERLERLKRSASRVA